MLDNTAFFARSAVRIFVNLRAAYAVPSLSNLTELGKPSSHSFKAPPLPCATADTWIQVVHKSSKLLFLHSVVLTHWVIIWKGDKKELIEELKIKSS